MMINGRPIGPGHRPYVIAEISGEHCGHLSRAGALILSAAFAGADAVKLQCFDPEKLTEARGGNRVLTEGLWKGRTLLDLYKQTHTPREWFPQLFDYARKVRPRRPEWWDGGEHITLFSSVFDEEGVDFLEKLGCPAYKIASMESGDLALIRKAASTGKPLIISTGMASEDDIEQVADVVEGIHENVAFLHCVSSYPCSIGDANLRNLDEVQAIVSDAWQGGHAIVGLSDHTLGWVAPVVATALGASIIEKHITLDRNNGGPDAPFSLEPDEFKEMVQAVKDAYSSLQSSESKPQDIYRSLRRKTQ